MNQGMYGTAEFQVTAQTNGQVIKMTFFSVDGQQVSQCLCGVVMTAVTGIDDGHGRVHGSNHRRPFFGMTHGDDVCIAAYHAYSIRNAFPFGCRAAVCFGKAQHTAAQFQHSRFKAQAGSGRGFKKEGSQFFSAACVAVFIGIGDDVTSGGNQFVNFLDSQVCNINQISHFTSVLQLSSLGLLRKAMSLAMSDSLM